MECSLYKQHYKAGYAYLYVLTYSIQATKCLEVQSAGLKLRLS